MPYARNGDEADLAPPGPAAVVLVARRRTDSSAPRWTRFHAGAVLLTRAGPRARRSSLPQWPRWRLRVVDTLAVADEAVASGRRPGAAAVRPREQRAQARRRYRLGSRATTPTRRAGLWQLRSRSAVGSRDGSARAADHGVVALTVAHVDRVGTGSGAVPVRTNVRPLGSTIVSEPGPPQRRSLPRPPSSVSIPDLPRSESGPDPPYNASPSRRSLPASPRRMSFPPRACIRVLSRPPPRASPVRVPLRVLKANDAGARRDRPDLHACFRWSAVIGCVVGLSSGLPPTASRRQRECRRRDQRS